MAGQGNKGRNSKNKSKSNKKRSWGSRLSSLAKGFKPGGGPFNKHRSRGGGGAYGSNNIGMTISGAKKLYANQLAEGISLQQAMASNKAETVRFQDLLDEKNDTKKNTMALTDKQSKLNQIYLDEVGRGASYGTKGGADYWLDTHAQGDNVDWDNIRRMIGGSDEGKKFKASGVAKVGGIDASKSISSQAGPGTWASHFAPGGVFANENAAGAATAIAKDINFGSPKPVGQEDGVNITPDYFNTGVTDQTGADNTGTTIPKEISDGWWNQFADADAFKKFLQGDAKEETKSDGMGDFMKFMMLMNVMGGGRGGGGGYGGSQFGYGGMNPGGVQAAYDPMKQLQGMGTWFKDNFGSGSASTGTINT